MFQFPILDGASTLVLRWLQSVQVEEFNCCFSSDILASGRRNHFKAACSGGYVMEEAGVRVQYKEVRKMSLGQLQLRHDWLR